MVKQFYRYEVDCGARGVLTTRARSAAEAISRLKFRIRKQTGAIPMDKYWGEPQRLEIWEYGKKA